LSVNIAEHRLIEMLRDGLLKRLRQEALTDQHLARLADAVSVRARDPYSIVEEIIAKVQLKDSTANSNAPSTGSASAEKIQHLGVAVNSIDEALDFWRDGIGLDLGEIEVVADQGVRVAMLPLGESRIELLEATGPETPIGKFIAKRGPGIHHICVEVQDIRATLARLKDRATRLIDEEPRRGAGGALVAFIHPASTGGVLVELVEKDSGRH
jgi:methylmalonyl-CoA/ethylmalonyl-CoA epimerase